MTVENAGTGPAGPVQSAWGRFFGEQIDNSYQAFAAPNANGQIFGFQAGLDLWRGSFIPEQRDAAGLYFAYGNANLNVSGLVTNEAATGYVRSPVGTLGLNGYSVGGYWTHYGPGNWYFDAVVQGTIYGGSADAQFSAMDFTSKLPTDGSGVITSLETGYPVALPGLGPRFIFEPQAQILWQHVGFNQAFDGLQTVGLGNTSGVTGRLGVRGQWSIAGANGQIWQPYARANFWRAWGANAATDFSNASVLVPLVEQATWGEVAAGVTFKYTQQLSYYAQFGYQFALTSNTGISGFIGDIGLRYTW
jgi:outer membrane autotransporter protein